MKIKPCLAEGDCENATIITGLLLRVEQLERDLADVDRMVACHASIIDGNPRSMWPRNSILGKAVDRHTARRVKELEHERQRAQGARSGAQSR